jgi:steroid 5-alpha reductase family enzyme
MHDLHSYFLALSAALLLSLAAWVISIYRRDVSIVDGLWSLMFLLCLLIYLMNIDEWGPRSWMVLGMVTIWALRLSVHISIRNHGQPEDYRYQVIRRNHEPHFWFKSLYIVFLLQGFLAWVISLPTLAAVNSQVSIGPLDYLGVALWLIGMIFEVVGDLQLSNFRRSSTEAGSVLDTGLWRYTRHPNYFGEATIWWGFYLVALSAGAWWTIFAPLLMTFLLLRVSGVAMLEKDIAHRRPAYRDYVRRTNAFFPGPSRSLRG